MADTTFAAPPQPAAPALDAPQSRRDHILSAAANCFARAGFHGTSMQEICLEAEMSPGALYRYFRSKDEIIGAIVAEERAHTLALLTQDAAGKPFVEHLVQLGLHFLAKMSCPGKSALMAEVIAECQRNSDIGQMFKVKEADSRRGLRALMARAVASGEIDEPADTDATMSCMMAVVEGLVVRMAAEPDLTIDRVEPLLRQLVKALFKPLT